MVAVTVVAEELWFREKIFRLVTLLLSTPEVTIPKEPSIRRFPLKLVERTMRSMEEIAESIWDWLAEISAADSAPELDEATTRLSISESSELTSPRADSATANCESGVV